MTTNDRFNISRAKDAEGASFGYDPDPKAFYVFDAHTNAEVAGPFDTHAEALVEARRMEV
jgi:hypothetical protein